MLGYSLAQEES